MWKSNNSSLIGGTVVASGKIVLSGVIFSRLKRRKSQKGEKIVSFDLLVCGKRNYSVISIVTTGELAKETEYNHRLVDHAPFVNVEGRLKSGMRNRDGEKQPVIYLFADKVEFVSEPRLIPYKVG